VTAFTSVQQSNQFLDTPDVTRDPRFHRGCDAERRMHAGEGNLADEMIRRTLTLPRENEDRQGTDSAGSRDRQTALVIVRA
jgi:hypothetical protein